MAIAAEGIEADSADARPDAAGKLRLRLPSSAGDRLLGFAHEAGAVVTAFVPERSSLEEVFVGALEEVSAP